MAALSRVVLLVLSLLCSPALLLLADRAEAAVLSNTELPLDTAGQLLRTGEASVLSVGGAYYLFFNDWGGCEGVDCCASSGGCASCCFSPPSPAYPDACVYTSNHSVIVYRTADFERFDYLGVALSRESRRDGIEFRPQVLYQAAAASFVMWYEDRWAGQQGYAVAVSSRPEGPYTTVHDSVLMAGQGRVGDYDLFVDDDGAAFHVRTGLVVERLNAEYTAGTGEVYELRNAAVEGPSMFKRDGVYYLLAGQGCCACRGGSNVVVYSASAPLGPYALQGDVGSNSSQPFDRHSPYNYVTRAQGSKVFVVPDAAGAEQFVWLGNQWVTSSLPGRPRNHDLLYWTVLQFDAQGSVQQIIRQPALNLTVGRHRPQPQQQPSVTTVITAVIV